MQRSFRRSSSKSNTEIIFTLLLPIVFIPFASCSSRCRLDPAGCSFFSRYSNSPACFLDSTVAADVRGRQPTDAQRAHTHSKVSRPTQRGTAHTGARWSPRWSTLGPLCARLASPRRLTALRCTLSAVSSARRSHATRSPCNRPPTPPARAHTLAIHRPAGTLSPRRTSSRAQPRLAAAIAIEAERSGTHAAQAP
jgi:hypothetical protein